MKLTVKRAPQVAIAILNRHTLTCRNGRLLGEMSLPDGSPDPKTYKEAQDGEGRIYYYHSVSFKFSSHAGVFSFLVQITKQSTWELPPGAIIIKRIGDSSVVSPVVSHLLQAAQSIDPIVIPGDGPASGAVSTPSFVASSTIVRVLTLFSSSDVHYIFPFQPVDWIECREVLSGRLLYYHSRSLRIMFETPTEGKPRFISETFSMRSAISKLSVTSLKYSSE